ncbi:MAG: DegT/DnrJ/EryC1/StrS family aminotransferase, partial [bacterium]
MGLHKYANLLDSFENKNKSEPTFCIITPVFDPAFISLKKLIIDLKGQTYKNFIHVLVSNGNSPLIESYVAKLNKTDDRFIYVETIQELTVSFEEIMVNSGKRRDFCLQYFNAKWYHFLDTDTHITENSYLAKLYVVQKLITTNIMLVKTKYHGTTYPIDPIDVEGHITIVNYCFSKSVAKRNHYPTNYKDGDLSNDFKYWLKISKNQKVTILDVQGTTEGDERSYKRMTDKKIEGMLGKEMISVFGNSFDNQLAVKLQPVFDSHMVGHGAEVVRFESAFSACIGFEGGVATNSCTNAFWILLKALGLRSNDEVLIPGTHFFGIKNVLEILKIKYRVVDVDATIPNASLESIKGNITKNTKVIIGLEYGGYPFAIKELKKHLNKIKRNDIILVLDAANSPFTKQHRKYTANQYDYALYSFDMNKILVTGEGGMILG